MEPRADFIFREPSSYSLVPSTVRNRSLLLSSRQGAKIQYDLYGSSSYHFYTYIYRLIHLHLTLEEGCLSLSMFKKKKTEMMGPNHELIIIKPLVD